MAHVVLVTGGCRSGKSAYALKRAEGIAGRRAFIATCPVLDEEMAGRVRRHKETRRRAAWDTIEEQVDLAGVIARTRDYDVLLVDCLTLWINNVMFRDEQAGHETSEDDIARRAQEILAACAAFDGVVLFVTNEVGWGIVPDNALARRFRDLAGRCNQVMGAGANEVVLVVCGMPVTVKS